MSEKTIAEQHDIDEAWMQYALNLADKAESIGEVPVGAVLILDQEVIGEGYNTLISAHDCCGHAEINALRSGGTTIENYRLIGATLYVTLEPCCMCAGAIVHSRIARLVYGAKDLKTGAVDSAFNILRDPKNNHQVSVTSGVLESKCGNKISAFFARRRKEKKLAKAQLSEDASNE